MQKFIYYAPTEVVFGKDTEKEAGTLVKKYGGTKALLVYGGGSVLKSGLLERVKQALSAENISFAEWGGVQPNPRLSHAQAGSKFAIGENVDFMNANKTFRTWCWHFR